MQCEHCGCEIDVRQPWVHTPHGEAFHRACYGAHLDEVRARLAGVKGGQGRSDGEVYAAGAAILWSAAILAAAVIGWIIWKLAP